jgi:hypothetical protein
VLRESSFRTVTRAPALVKGFFLLNSPIIRRLIKKAAAASIDPIDCSASSPEPGSTYAIALCSVASIRHKQKKTVSETEIRRFIHRFPSGARLKVNATLSEFSLLPQAIDDAVVTHLPWNTASPDRPWPIAT